MLKMLSCNKILLEHFLKTMLTLDPRMETRRKEFSAKEHSTRAQTSTFGFNWHGGWEGILKTLWKLFKEEKFIAVVMMLNDWWKNEEIIVAWRLHNEQNRFRHKHYLCDVCRRPGVEEIFDFDFRSMRFPNVGGNEFSWFAFTGEAAMKIKQDDWRCHKLSMCL